MIFDWTFVSAHIYLTKEKKENISPFIRRYHMAISIDLSFYIRGCSSIIAIGIIYVTMKKILVIYHKLTVFSRMLRDSTPCYVRPLVSRSVGR